MYTAFYAVRSYARAQLLPLWFSPCSYVGLTLSSPPLFIHSALAHALLSTIVRSFSPCSRSPLHPKPAPLPKHTTGSTTSPVAQPRNSAIGLYATLNPSTLLPIAAHIQPTCHSNRSMAPRMLCKWSRINQAINFLHTHTPLFIFVELLD